MRTALALAPILLASCGGAQVAPTPRAAFPDEALGFRFGASYEEAQDACPGDWHAYPRWERTQHTLCASSGHVVSLTLDGEPLRVVAVGEASGADSSPDARRAADEASIDIESRYGAPTTTHERERVWRLDGGSIYVGYSGPSSCANGPVYTVGITYSVRD